MKRLLFFMLIMSACLMATSQHRVVIPFSYNPKNGIAVSGQWEHPSCWGTDDGELHVAATGGTTNFAYKLFYPDGSTETNTSGNFLELGPGYHEFEVYDFGSGVVDGYPGILLSYPYASAQLHTNLNNFDPTPLVGSFGIKPGKN